MARFADFARQRSVHSEPFLSCGLPGGLESVGNTVAVAEVHLVRHLASERGVRQSLIVLGHVEPDELLDRLDAVECVQGSELSRKTEDCRAGSADIEPRGSP